jgi:hypothetical protein
MTKDPKVTCCTYVPQRVKARLEKWAEGISTQDRTATPGDALTQASDALTEAKWKPGMKLKALK